MFVLSLLLPLQTKGPTLVLTLRLVVSPLESFQLCPSIFGRGVIPLKENVKSSLCYTPLAWPQPTSSTWNMLLHQLDAFSCRLFELQVESCVAPSWLRSVPHRVYSIHCQPIGFGRTFVIAPWVPLWL
jgi:hypothetical protein